MSTHSDRTSAACRASPHHVRRIDVRYRRGNSLDTTQELFVVSRTGRGVFRMRGRFWNTATMDRVAGILGAEETVRREPVTLAELRETDPALLYWFERRTLTR